MKLTTLAATMAAPLCAALLATSAPATAAPSTDPVTIKDPHGDVIKYYTTIRPRTGHLDIWKETGKVSDDKAVFTVTVDNLRRSDTKDVGTGGWHQIASTLAVRLLMGKKAYDFLYAPQQDPSGIGPFDETNCPEDDPVNVYDIHGVDQAANYDRDTYTISIPVACFPDRVSSVRFSAYTGWDTKSGSFSDNINKSTSLMPRYSDPLTIR